MLEELNLRNKVSEDKWENEGNTEFWHVHEQLADRRYRLGRTRQ